MIGNTLLNRYHVTDHLGDEPALRPGLGADAAPAGVRWHGPQFRAAMDVLVTEALGEAAALLLRAGYDAAGVRS